MRRLLWCLALLTHADEIAKFKKEDGVLTPPDWNLAKCTYLTLERQKNIFCTGRKNMNRNFFDKFSE